MNEELSKNIMGASAKRTRIFVVEDEDSIALLLRHTLETEGYEVDVIPRGDDAEERLRDDVPDMLILDWMLPGVSGFELCRRLRMRPQTQSVPIIMLTARGEESERVRGLANGADDYISKPFSVPELVARIGALMRRTRPTKLSTQLSLGDITLNRETHRVTRQNRDLAIGPTEFRLLEHLMERAGRVFSRTQLLDAIWGRENEIDERTVDVHIGRLRKALGSPPLPDPIRTVRGAGYSFDEMFARSAA
jgi:two-component system, OmpR family, phosphate regulon response regulator PhoB